MILEMVAARFFAPYIGTSIAVWTSVIGIIMTGLSAGYVLGGMLGDKWRSPSQLRLLVFAAALWIGMLAALHEPMIGTFASVLQSQVTLSIVAAISLLLVPSILLGSVTPYAVRLASSDVQHVGRVAGNLSAISTAGSILGTFAAGLILIPALGTNGILFGCAAVLGFVALARPTMRSVVSCAAFFFLLLVLSRAEHFLRDRRMARHSIVAEVDSPYSVIRIRRFPAYSMANNLDTVFLQIDHGNHAAYTPAEPDNHVFPYTQHYRLSDVFRPDATRALLLGGGGYTVARDFLSRHPKGAIDVVEIDPTVTALAKQYFDLQDDPRLFIAHEDARRFLNRGGPEGAPGSREGAYHVVYGDAFRSEYNVPFHLASLEAAQRIAALLDNDGVYVLNLIASEEGKRSQILRAELATLRAVFPSVVAFRVRMGNGFVDPQSLENITLVASKKLLSEEALSHSQDTSLAAMLGNRIDTTNMPQVAVLTDDYAPVEAMLSL